MEKRGFTHVFTGVLRKVAPRIGATVVMEPEWSIVGQINFKGGRRRYFRRSSLDLNPLGASEIAKDKDFANYFMRLMGYPVIPDSKAFFSKDWAGVVGQPDRGIDAAWRHALHIGLPVVIKPNSGSQGVGVTMIRSKADFYRAMRAVFKRDRVALVQRPVAGKDYRIVVLDDRVISAYERIPLSIVGDGRSTVKGLLKRKQKAFVASGRDTRIESADPRITSKLRNRRMTLASVPAKGERVFLLDNANLSSGGDSVDVTKEIHPAFKKLAVKLTWDMGLRLCGVDLMVAGDITRPPGKFWVIEINSAPGLDHYAKSGKAQEKIVEDLYLEVLKSMAVAR